MHKQGNKIQMEFHRSALMPRKETDQTFQNEEEDTSLNLMFSKITMHLVIPPELCKVVTPYYLTKVVVRLRILQI